MAFTRYPNINQFDICGEVNTEPERGTGKTSGIPYCRLQVRVDCPFFDQALQHMKHNYNFVRVTLFADQADRMARCQKGDGVLISGSLTNPIPTCGEQGTTIVLKARRAQWIPRTTAKTEDDAQGPDDIIV